MCRAQALAARHADDERPHQAEAVRLQRAILALPDKQQLAFNLRYYDNMSFAEIADVTDSTPASAKTNYHIAKEKIIRYMNNHD